jgi:uncharacterized protein (DUF849 family)
MLLQAALNGARTKADHPAMPVLPDELAQDAAKCVARGAGSIHLHPRDADGRERLDPDVIDPVVRLVRAACGLPICVSTGAWIEPDIERRVEQIRKWREPDLATVNVCEEGADDVIAALLEAGVEIEAGISYVEDVGRLVAFGVADRVTRILVEPVDLTAEEAEEVVDEIHRSLDSHALVAPRLQHGDGEATWVLVADAVRRGIDTRIGFEDTLFMPDGRLAASNAELVRAAGELGGGAHSS